MVGRKTFDTSKALDQALIVFWDAGYQAASYSALKEATGLNKSSLRNAFGDKEELYEKCLEHFDKTYYEPLLAKLEKPGLKQVITEHFEALFDRFAESHVRRGSLAAMTALATGGYNGEKDRYVKDQIVRLRELFERRFRAAIADGELPEDTDVKGLVSTMLVLSRSLAVMYRDAEEIDILRDAVRTTIRVLDNPPRIANGGA